MEPSRPSIILKTIQGQPPPQASSFLLLVNYARHEDVYLIAKLFCLYQHGAAVNTGLRGESGEADALPHTPPSNELKHLQIKISMGLNMGFRFMAGMVMVMRPMVAQVLMVVYLGGPHGSARGDVRAGAHAHGCGPCRHGNVRGSAHECGRARANACVRAFLP